MFVFQFLTISKYRLKDPQKMEPKIMYYPIPLSPTHVPVLNKQESKIRVRKMLKQPALDLRKEPIHVTSGNLTAIVPFHYEPTRITSLKTIKRKTRSFKNGELIWGETVIMPGRDVGPHSYVPIRVTNADKKPIGPKRPIIRRR